MPATPKAIPVSEPDISGNEKKYVLDCIETGWISSLGSYVTDFEEKFSRYCGAKHGVAVNNGTSALHLALAACGIGKGDEVIIPDMTFIATANVIAYLGGTPVFVDAEPRTWNIDVTKIKSKITKKTKAIMPVHLYGHPCDMDPLRELAEENGLLIIEDAAEAHGAEYKGKKVGALGTVGCFSFYGNKVITTGEGGMCVTNDEELAERMRLLKDHGMSAKKRYWHTVTGFNFRMTNIQAAIGVAQLEKIDQFIATKRVNAALYNKLLAGVKGGGVHRVLDNSLLIVGVGVVDHRPHGDHQRDRCDCEHRRDGAIGAAEKPPQETGCHRSLQYPYEPRKLAAALLRNG